jgi:hypothetical protein
MVTRLWFVGSPTTMILGFPFQWMVHSVGVVGSHNSSFLPSWMVLILDQTKSIYGMVIVICCLGPMAFGENYE